MRREKEVQRRVKGERKERREEREERRERRERRKEREEEKYDPLASNQFGSEE